MTTPNTHFDPTLVRQTIKLAEEMEIAQAGGNNALPAARDRLITFVENLTTREVLMLTGVRSVGVGDAQDLFEAIDAAAANLVSKPALAFALADDPELDTHLANGLKKLLIEPTQA